jgi:hypothetical protein
MVELIDKVPWGLAIVLALTLGLAPFTPPHLFEKLGMLGRGELSRAIDWFDLFLHGAPWLLLVAKGIVAVMRR